MDENVSVFFASHFIASGNKLAIGSKSRALTRAIDTGGVDCEGMHRTDRVSIFPLSESES